MCNALSSPHTLLARLQVGVLVAPAEHLGRMRALLRQATAAAAAAREAAAAAGAELHARDGTIARLQGQLAHLTAD